VDLSRDEDSEAEIRDAVAGEPPPQSVVHDGGYLLVEDFESRTTEGWQILHWIDAGAPNPDWSVVHGDLGSVYVEGTLDTGNWHISYWAAGAAADQIVEARMRVVDFQAQAPSYAAGLFGRYDPTADSGYFVALRGDGSLIIRKRDRGTSASWGPGVDLGIQAEVWHTVRLEILGDTLHAYLDGAFVYAVTDLDPLPAGGIALGTYGATLEVDRVFLAVP
jgi:hypothetical protein